MWEKKKRMKFLFCLFILASFGDFCLAYNVEPPVHQWIALQAYLKIADDPDNYAELVSEMQDYLPADPCADYCDLNFEAATFSPPCGWNIYNNSPAPDGYPSLTALIEGTWEEDMGETFDYYGWQVPINVVAHFWGPNGGYDAGLDIGLLGGPQPPCYYINR